MKNLQILLFLLLISFVGISISKIVKQTSRSTTISKTVSSSKENPIDFVSKFDGEFEDFNNYDSELESPITKKETQDSIEYVIDDVKKEDVSIEIEDGVLKIVLKKNKDGKKKKLLHFFNFKFKLII